MGRPGGITWAGNERIESVHASYCSIDGVYHLRPPTGFVRESLGWEKRLDSQSLYLVVRMLGFTRGTRTDLLELRSVECLDSPHSAAARLEHHRSWSLPVGTLILLELVEMEATDAELHHAGTTPQC